MLMLTKNLEVWLYVDHSWLFDQYSWFQSSEPLIEQTYDVGLETWHEPCWGPMKNHGIRLISLQTKFPKESQNPSCRPLGLGGASDWSTLECLEFLRSLERMFWEKWERKFWGTTHGLSDCNAWDKVLLSYRTCMIRIKQLQGSRTSIVHKATFLKWHCALSS